MGVRRVKLKTTSLNLTFPEYPEVIFPVDPFSFHMQSLRCYPLSHSCLVIIHIDFSSKLNSGVGTAIFKLGKMIG